MSSMCVTSPILIILSPKSAIIKNGNRQSVIYPNGTVAEYTYDSLNRLTRLFNRKANGDTISCYEYTLGLAGNRTRVVEHTGRTVDYTYDDTYKLTSEIINDPVFGSKTISYTYDAVGNRLTKIEDGASTTYSYNDNDWLITENSQLTVNTYQYDDNGNTIAKNSAAENITYGYDFNNRLISMNDGADLIAYAYDTDGMRVQKSVNGNVTKYLLDKNRDYAQVLEEVDALGNTIVSYTYSDDLISQNRSSLKSYYHYDGQLSTRQLTDASAEVTDTYTYDAFGLLLNRSGATENNYMYTGEQYDANVGFYYLRARYYNPTIGRFHTMDTWPGMQFEPMSLHKYLYCDGNPINCIDPSGNVKLVEITWVMTGWSILQKVALTMLLVLAGQLVWEGELDLWDSYKAGGLSTIKNFALKLIPAAKVTAWGKYFIDSAEYIARYHWTADDPTTGGYIIAAISHSVAHGTARTFVNNETAFTVTRSIGRGGLKNIISDFILETEDSIEALGMIADNVWDWFMAVLKFGDTERPNPFSYGPSPSGSDN